MQDAPPTSSCKSRLAGDRPRKLGWVWTVTPHGLWPKMESYIRFVYALRWEGRSLVGRIQTLLSRKQWGVTTGPDTVCLLDGRVLKNRRTAVRKRGIEELVSRYPWASTIDLQMFLDGFDLGERYGQSSLGTAAPDRPAIESL